MKESEIEAYLVKRVEALGGVVRKVRWIGRRGAPDRFIAIPVGERRAMSFGSMQSWVELKAPGEKLRAGQEKEHEILALAGVKIVVLDSIEAVDRHLDFSYLRRL